MFDKALIALDLSPAESAMLDCLATLRACGTRELALVHVVQVGYGQGAAMASAAVFKDWLEQHAKPLRQAGFMVSTQVRGSGSPADEILAAAAETGAGLLIAGSRGQNLLSTLFLGSVARELVRRSPLPLLLQWIEPAAPGQHCAAVCPDLLRHLLFATDFSTRAEPARQVVAALAGKAQRLSCVHVAENPQDVPAARASMDRLVADLARHHAPAAGTVIEGSPAAGIAAHALQQDASLIVLGRRGQNPLASLLVGSTAASVCEVAGRPVLIVP